MLTYLEENNIGDDLEELYEALGVVFERERNFIEADKYYCKGLSKYNHKYYIGMLNPLIGE